MNSSTSSASSSQQFASDSLRQNESSSLAGRSRMGTVIYIWIMLQSVMVFGILVYEYSLKGDGKWSDWGNWSPCKDGLSKRSRNCTNPPLSIFWRNCYGDSVEYKTCDPSSCKGFENPYRDTTRQAAVHGGWGEWSPWGMCSVSCDVGLQRRDRSCSNPYPSRNGDHCFGESRDDRICMPGACADGGWSNWGNWGTCSDSCGGGVRSRLRTCSNPRPSLLGRSCDGSPEQTMPCNKQSCEVPTDGEWSSWGSWGACSDSCGGGVRSRLRTCSNPRPSLLGRYCDGSPEQTMLCNRHACAEFNVAFTAYNLNTSVSSYSILQFTSTDLNNGNAYSTATGKFTCPVAGVYHFSVTLAKLFESIQSLLANLRINGINKLDLFWNPYDDSKNEYEATPLTMSGTFHLNKNDVVYVDGIPNYFYDNRYSQFTGYLITPE